MHPNARRALIDRIVAVAQQATDDPNALEYGYRSWGAPEGPYTALGQKAAAEFHSVVERLASKSDWGNRFSLPYFDKRLSSILVAAHQHGRDEAERLLDDLIAEQQGFATEQRVFIPVSGLTLMIPELTVGKVTFRTGTPTGVSEESEVGRYLRERVFAEYRVIAEPIKAGELGAEQTRQALEAITFAHVASAPYGHFSDAVIAIESEKVAPAAWVGVVSPIDAYFEYRRTERSWHVLISSGSLQDLNAHGLTDLSEMLTRETTELSELELTILRAVHWLASAQVQLEDENRLLNLTTCLEALVGPLDHKTDPISGTMAESVALIIGSGYEPRRQIRKFIVDQYGARSGVSHRGTRSVPAADIRQLREIVVRLILRLLAMRGVIKERKGLFAWLERTRLGGPLASPGEKRTLTELRAERGLLFMDLVRELGCQPEELDHWERAGPDLITLRRVANALDVPIERIAPPRHHFLINHRGHRFLLGARRESEQWIARVKGYDPNDAEAKPYRAIDPENPHARSPSIIATAGWTFEADSPDAALEGLRKRIDDALERALHPSRLPDDPEDWQPPSASHD